MGELLTFPDPYAWISKGLPQPDVIWLWRYEDGLGDWQKVMDAADQNDIVLLVEPRRSQDQGKLGQSVEY
jgi:hypothetical protein